MTVSSTGLSTSDTGLILPSCVESYYIPKRTKMIQIISTPVYMRHWSLVQRLEKWVTSWLTFCHFRLCATADVETDAEQTWFVKQFSVKRLKSCQSWGREGSKRRAEYSCQDQNAKQSWSYAINKIGLLTILVFILGNKKQN